MFDFRGKTVIITGAGRGLGLSIAESFAKAGASVIATATTIEKLDAAKLMLERYPGEHRCLALDVTSFASCAAAVSEAVAAYGKIDIIVNNAASFLEGWDLGSITVADIDAEIDTTYRGVVYMTKAVLPHLLERKAGTMVTIASQAGADHPHLERFPIYAADKAAVMQFVRAMQAALTGTGVRLCLTIPGRIRDDGSDLLAEGALSRSDVAQVVLMQCIAGDNLHMAEVMVKPIATPC